MRQGNLVTIEHLEVQKSLMAKIKRFFNTADDSEAVRLALEATSGKIELEAIFEKHKGAKIKKVYA